MMKKKRPIFKFQPFSRKQRQIFTWWADKSPVKDAVGIIADGAIRSGKTVSMSLSYVMWAMSKYDGQNFIMAGKTISSFKRNVLQNLKLMLTSRGYHWIYHISGEFPNMLEVTRNGKTNYFYIFGGKDEGSQDLVQGITAAGAFFDEVALMPESFVNQATGRCSVEGATWWFNCNPAGPMHWFKLEWIDKRKKKRLLYLHFTMDDNLSLSEKVKEKYREMYAGVFYLRYIKGMWAVAEGLIYTMLTKENLYTNADRPPRRSPWTTVPRTPAYFWRCGTMGKRCGLIGSTVGTAGQRKQDAAGTHRGRIRSTRTIWRSSWDRRQKISAWLLWTRQQHPLLQNSAAVACM